MRHFCRSWLGVTLLSLITAATVVSATEASATPPTAAPAMDTLVTTEWLAANLGEADLVVLDCTVRVERTEEGGLEVLSGRAGYEAGHIPTAGFADLLGELSDGDSPHRFTVPSPEQFATAMAALGVGDGSRVVLYDQGGSGWAARVWWMLRWIGFDRAALLDGGLAAWKAEGRPLSTEPATRPTAELTVSLRPRLIADRDEVRAALGRDDVVLVDALPAAHYRGEMAMYARPGHIPGAVNAPSMSLLDETGRLLPQEQLAARLPGDRDARTITYCGGGIAASLDAFALTRLGHTDVAVYAASLQEWAADSANPMATEAPAETADAAPR